MERIKNYFSGWDLSRIVRIVLAVALGIGYFTSKENIYLMGAIFLGAQAIFNISCPGGSCSTPTTKGQKTIVKVKEYKPEK
ncbi:MAG: hypothetical protein PHS59_01765 [Paludibacter sp.]|nr:hypothetical protein [Paludibacter sp.]